MTVKDKFSFAVGLIWLLVAGLSFASRNSPYGGTWNHYVWLLWALGSVYWFWRSSKPFARKPE